LLASTRPPDRIVVVANEALPDSPAPGIVRQIPRAQLISNQDNRGYSIACNQGWRAAPADLVLFLNEDVTVEPEAIDACVAASQADPTVGIVTCRLLRPDGSLDHACHRGTPTVSASVWYALRLHRLLPRSHRFARYTRSWSDPRTDHDIEACSGAFLLITRTAIEAVDGWDERYWFYADDLDLCLRVRQAGHRVRYVGTVSSTHLKGVSSHLKTPDGELSAEALATKRRIQAAVIDSHEWFYRRHLRDETPWVLRIPVEVGFRFQRRRARRLRAAYSKPGVAR
jgi:GT2 family glycosyltransferase